MSFNSFGNLLKVTTFGESHGTAIGGIIDGFPAGLEVEIDANLVNLKLLHNVKNLIPLSFYQVFLKVKLLELLLDLSSKIPIKKAMTTIITQMCIDLRMLILHMIKNSESVIIKAEEEVQRVKPLIG